MLGGQTCHCVSAWWWAGSVLFNEWMSERQTWGSRDPVTMMSFSRSLPSLRFAKWVALWVP